MDLSIRRWTRRVARRPWILALIVNLGVASTGLPCLTSCAADLHDAAAHDQDACHHDGHGADRDGPDSGCLQDQPAGIAVHDGSHGFPLTSTALSASSDAPLVASAAPRAMPAALDRSPPIPPAFAVLRPLPAAVFSPPERTLRRAIGVARPRSIPITVSCTTWRGPAVPAIPLENRP